MTNEEIIMTLENAKECIKTRKSVTNKCKDFSCENCQFHIYTEDLLEAYNEVIYKLEMLGGFEEEYHNVVLEIQDLTDENEQLRKEVKKRRREKRKWKRKALMYENCLETMRDRVRVINSKLKGDLNDG